MHQTIQQSRPRPSTTFRRALRSLSLLFFSISLQTVSSVRPTHVLYPTLIYINMRTSLIAAAAALGLASTAVAGSHDRFALAKRQAAAGPSDAEILNYALTLERLEKVSSSRDLPVVVLRHTGTSASACATTSSR